VGLLLLVLGCAFAYSNSLNLEFYYLAFHDGDGFVHYRQLMTMFEGLKEFDPIKLLSFNLNYGFLYFFGNLVFCIPALLMKNMSLFVWIPRMIGSVFGLVSLVYSIRIFRLYIGRSMSILFGGLMVVMPAFWVASKWFRPDWVLTAILMAALYYWMRDNMGLKRDFWISVGLMGLALSIKTQALTFLPIYVCSIFYPEWTRLDFSKFWEHLKVFAKFILSLIGIFILANPYVLHPVGFYAVFRRFWLQMTYMVTDAYIPEPTPFAHRFDEMGLYFFTKAGLIIIVLGSIWYLVRCFFQKKDSVFAVISVYILANLANLMLLSQFFNWNHLIPVMAMSIFLLIPILQQVDAKRQIRIGLILLAILLAFQAPAIGAVFKPMVITSDARVAENEKLVIKTLRGKIPAEAHILAHPKIHFNYEKLDLLYPRVHLIWGGLYPDHLHAAAFAEKWKHVDLKKHKVKAFYPKKYVIIKKVMEDTIVLNNLISGKLAYVLIAENDDIAIYKWTGRLNEKK
jgi:hypothetical protein